MKVTSLSILFAMLALASNSKVCAAQTSSDNLQCNEVVLDVLLDTNPHETGWKLVCDNETETQTLWDVPIGSLTPGSAEEWVQSIACIPNNSNCVFTIMDQSGDGLLRYGWYSLTVGATTVAAYEYGSNKPFLEETFCFGPECDQVPLELQDDDEYYDDYYNQPKDDEQEENNDTETNDKDRQKDEQSANDSNKNDGHHNNVTDKNKVNVTDTNQMDDENFQAEHANDETEESDDFGKIGESPPSTSDTDVGRRFNSNKKVTNVTIAIALACGASVLLILLFCLHKYRANVYEEVVDKNEGDSDTTTSDQQQSQPHLVLDKESNA